MVRPRLWIAYDHTSVQEAVAMLESILERHPDPSIIHEIGRPTLLAAALAGRPVVQEFRDRLGAGHTLVVDFKGFDVPFSAEGRFYYAAGADLVTVMACAPDEAVAEAIDGAAEAGRLVAFDLMSYEDQPAKIRRACRIVEMGATLVSVHTGWSEQRAGKRPEDLIAAVRTALAGSGAQVIAMGGLTPARVPPLTAGGAGDLFAIVAGSAITRADDPSGVVTAFRRALES